MKLLLFFGIGALAYASVQDQLSHAAAAITAVGMGTTAATIVDRR